MDALGDAEAVALAFREAAETAKLVKSRREQRGEDNDPRELCMIELLCESLEEGATQCEEKLKTIGSAIDKDNLEANSALKDVIITLQGIDLKISKALGNAKLDAKSLYKLSITAQTDASRAIDQVHQKDPSGRSQYGDDDDRESVRRFDDSRSIISQSARLDSAPPTDFHPLNPPAPLFSPFTTDQDPLYQQILPAHDPISIGARDRFHQAPPDPSVPRRRMVPPPRSVASGSSEKPPLVTINSGSEHTKLLNNRESDVMSQLSMHDSGFGSETASPMRRPSYIMSEDGYDHERTSTISSTSSPIWRLMHAHERNQSNPSISLAPSRPRTPRPGEQLRSDLSETEDVANGNSNSSAASIFSGPQAPEDFSRYAPEVVTPETASRLSPHPTPTATHARLISTPSSLQLNPHPPPSVASSFPVQEPSSQNNWHGFCEGAWRIRKSGPDGISMNMVSQSRGISVSRWSCKSCQFQSTVVNVRILPQQIYFNKRFATRYRWAFLAKSHFPAEKAFGDFEKYTYGCVFCLAEGQNTMMYKKLDPLLEHILAKHRPPMMAAEMKDRTKCIVGRVAEADERWDINLPEGDSKTALQAMRARVAAAKG